jgi:hypothetical protein
MSSLPSYVEEMIAGKENNPQSEITTINPDGDFDPVDHPELGLVR